VLDPSIPDDKKQQMISDLLQTTAGLDASVANEIAAGMVSEEGQQAAQQMSSNTGVDMYNALADMWNDVWTNISTQGVTLPLTPSVLGIDFPTGTIKIGGSGTGFTKI
jgi:hypothetical protein